MTFPSGSTFNGQFLALNKGQWGSMSNTLRPYLNLINYTVDGCLRARSVASWARFFDFAKDTSQSTYWEVRERATAPVLLSWAEVKEGKRRSRMARPHFR